jgi:hypothetical protein
VVKILHIWMRAASPWSLQDLVLFGSAVRPSIPMVDFQSIVSKGDARDVELSFRSTQETSSGVCLGC